MRIWSIHPKYLDPQGLVALWRETLLAQAVLRGETHGYRNHPQLDRFKACNSPLAAISQYLKGVHAEAMVRNYSFDKSKIHPTRKSVSIAVTTGQLMYEWEHLLEKLKGRSPDYYRNWKKIKEPEAHPLFTITTGNIESWERYDHRA